MGAAGSMWAQRKVKRKVAQLTPPAIAGAAVGAAKEITRDLRSVVSEGRKGMRERETQLKAKLGQRSNGSA